MAFAAKKEIKIGELFGELLIKNLQDIILKRDFNLRYNSLTLRNYGIKTKKKPANRKIAGFFVFIRYQNSH